MNLLKSGLCVVSVAMGGCAVGPAYEPPGVAAPVGHIGLEENQYVTSSAQGPGDLSRWWERLRDPVLSELMERAIVASPNQRLAQARVREARARGEIAGAGRYPTVTAQATATASGPTRTIRAPGQPALSTGGGVSGQFRAGFDAAWEVDVFGGVRRGAEAARADLEAALASQGDAQISLLAEVATNYIQLRAAQNRLQIAIENLAAQAEALKLTEWRAQAGLVSSQDVEQARSSVEQTQAQIPLLKLAMVQAEYALDVLLGEPPGTLGERLQGAAELPAVPGEIVVGIPAETLRQRPDVRAAERRVAAQVARIGVAEAARYPSLRLSGSIGIDALGSGYPGSSGGPFYSLVAGITAPIFDAGRLRNQVEVQRAIRDQVVVDYQQTVLLALQEVETALVSLARNLERIEALTRAAQAAENAALLARQRYAAGLVDFQSALDTQRVMLAVEDSLAATRAESIMAIIRLYKALGGGWSGAGRAPAEEEG